jgi:hypothetical protein
VEGGPDAKEQQCGDESIPPLLQSRQGKPTPSDFFTWAIVDAGQDAINQPEAD